MGSGFWLGVAQGFGEMEERKREERVSTNKERAKALAARYEKMMEMAVPEAIPELMQRYQRIAMLDPYDKKAEKTLEELANMPLTFISTQKAQPGQPQQQRTVPKAPLMSAGGEETQPPGTNTFNIGVPKPPSIEEVPPHKRSVFPTQQEANLRDLIANAGKIEQAWEQKKRELELEHQYRMEEAKPVIGEVQGTEEDLAQLGITGLPKGTYKYYVDKRTGQVLGQPLPMKESTTTSGVTAQEYALAEEYYATLLGKARGELTPRERILARSLYDYTRGKMPSETTGQYGIDPISGKRVYLPITREPRGIVPEVPGVPTQPKGGAQTPVAPPNMPSSVTPPRVPASVATPSGPSSVVSDEHWNAYDTRKVFDKIPKPKTSSEQVIYNRAKQAANGTRPLGTGTDTLALTNATTAFMERYGILPLTTKEAEALLGLNQSEGVLTLVEKAVLNAQGGIKPGELNRIDGLVKSVGSQLARKAQGEVGTLTDYDFARAISLLPSTLGRAATELLPAGGLKDYFRKYPFVNLEIFRQLLLDRRRSLVEFKRGNLSAIPPVDWEEIELRAVAAMEKKQSPKKRPKVKKVGEDQYVVEEE